MVPRNANNNKSTQTFFHLFGKNILMQIAKNQRHVYWNGKQNLLSGANFKLYMILLSHSFAHQQIMRGYIKLYSNKECITYAYAYSLGVCFFFIHKAWISLFLSLLSPIIVLLKILFEGQWAILLIYDITLHNRVALSSCETFL